MKKKIKAWATIFPKKGEPWEVMHQDTFFYSVHSSKKEAALSAKLEGMGKFEIVPCVISYTLPPKNTK